MTHLYRRTLTNHSPVPQDSHKWLTYTAGLLQTTHQYRDTLTSDSPVPQDSHKWLTCTAGLLQMTHLCRRTLTNDPPVPQDSHKWITCTAGLSQMTHLYRRTLTNDSLVPTAMNSPSGESSAQVTAEKGQWFVFVYKIGIFQETRMHWSHWFKFWFHKNTGCTYMNQEPIFSELRVGFPTCGVDSWNNKK